MSATISIEKVLMNKDHGVAIINQIRKAKRLGGTASRAADKVSKARTDFEALGASTLKSTNNGESRIAHCFKYDLGDGYRLVTIQKGVICMFLYFGDHDSTQKWIDKNKGLKLTINNDNSVQVVHSADSNSFDNPDITHNNIPYLERMEGISWENIIQKRSTRRRLLKIDENSDQEDICDLIDDLQEDNAELSSTIQNILGHLSRNNFAQAMSCLELYTGAAKEISETGEELTDEVLQDTNNSSNLVELSNLTDDEWEVILDPTKFQEWMVFLHPGQKRVVDEDFEIPALLTGIPGSGKTCVLVHRARRMVALYPGERALILTLNKNLSKLIEQLVSKLCTTEESRM